MKNLSSWYLCTIECVMLKSCAQQKWLLFVQVWQNSEDALLQMVVVVLVRLSAGNDTLPGWDNLGTGVQLLVVRSKPMSLLFPPHIGNPLVSVEPADL